MVQIETVNVGMDQAELKRERQRSFTNAALHAFLTIITLVWIVDTTTQRLAVGILGACAALGQLQVAAQYECRRLYRALVGGS
jgi:hypothetical protein